MMNKDLPKVTVVTVTYNAEQYLEQTIKSVIEQDYSNIEYIIIDGGSTDRTLEIIKKYEKYLAYWVSEPDDGIFYAMNKGIEVATGDWINFLNAGDTYVNKNILSKVISQTEGETDIILSHTNLVKENDSIKVFKADINNILQTTPCFHQ